MLSEAPSVTFEDETEHTIEPSLRVLRLFAAASSDLLAPAPHDGQVEPLSQRPYARAFVYGPETVDLFERAIDTIYQNGADRSLPPVIREGWRTYNFEVEEFHTYIAGDLRVHNMSVLDLVPRDATEVLAYDNDQNGILDTAIYHRPGGIEETIHAVQQGGNSVVSDRTITVPVAGGLGPGDVVRWQEVYQGNNPVPTDRRIVGVDYAGGSLQGEEIGRTLGSVLGSAIGGQDIFAQVGSATIAATLLQNIGEFLHKSIDLSLLDSQGLPVSPLEAAITDTFHDLRLDLAGNTGIQVINGLSSVLVGEIAEALHIEGFGRGVFTTVGNTVTSQVLSNIANMLEIPIPGSVVNSNVNLLSGFDTANMITNLGNSLGGFFGSQLGTLAVAPHSQQAALFGSAAAAVGSLVGGTALATALSVIPVIGTLIGAFAGQALGNLVGNAFFDDDRISRYTLFTDSNGYVQYGYPYTQDGASLVLSQYIAKTAADSVNSIFGSFDGRIDVNQTFNPFTVGWYVDSNNTKLMYAVNQQYQTNYSPQEAQGIVAAAVNYAVQNAELGGNDVILRRAYHLSHKSGLAQLGFDIQVAKDFEKYVAHTSLINSLIADNPLSEFSAGWIATLQRAKEMGLHKAIDFNYMEYLAANIPLQQSFGRDANALTAHFVNYGLDEGRVQFDAIQYLAANPGLAQGLGSLDRAAAAQHYIDYGRTEGRLTQFDYLQYLASNPGLAAELGRADPRTVQTHYILHGFFEGRGLQFDYLQYLAANPGLAQELGGINRIAAEKHYIYYGFYEGRGTTFETQRYIASYGDLIRAFGMDKTAAKIHYINQGYAEGRKITFDPAAYRDHNPDVAAAYNNDLAAIMLHYIRYGYYEGRDNGSGHPLASPVVLDLDGSGIDISLNGHNEVEFDIMGSGQQLPTAWAGARSGMLVIDLDSQGRAGADGVITHQHELDFWAAVTDGQPYDPSGVPSDMQALRLLYDTNHNGQLDPDDARWSEFRVWQDVNQNGVADSGELQTLADRHIVAIDLTPIGPSTKLSDGSIIRGTTTYTLADGTARSAADVQFAYGRSFDKDNPISLMSAADKQGYHLVVSEDVEGRPHATVDFSNEERAHVIDLNDRSFIQNLGVNESSTLIDVVGSKGDDIMFASKDNQLTGGTGADVFDFARATGKIVVTDFENSVDSLYFGIDRVNNIAELRSRAVQLGEDVTIKIADDTTVVLQHTNLDYLNVSTLLVT